MDNRLLLHLSCFIPCPIAHLLLDMLQLLFNKLSLSLPLFYIVFDDSTAAKDRGDHCKNQVQDANEVEGRLRAHVVEQPAADQAENELPQVATSCRRANDDTPDLFRSIPLGNTVGCDLLK